MVTNEDIIEAIKFGLCAAHVKFNNKNYYGEIHGSWNDKKDSVKVRLSELLLPIGGGLWKITQKSSQVFNINHTNCKVIKISDIDGQNFIGGRCKFGFKYINILSENNDYNDLFFMKINGSLTYNIIEKINNSYKKSISKQVNQLDDYYDKKIDSLNKKISNLKNLLNNKKTICTKCYDKIKYEQNFPQIK